MTYRKETMTRHDGNLHNGGPVDIGPLPHGKGEGSIPVELTYDNLIHLLKGFSLRLALDDDTQYYIMVDYEVLVTAIHDKGENTKSATFRKLK